jgi:hypothetical protein
MPLTTRTFCTAVVPRAFSSLEARLMPNWSASPPSDESSKMYHTVRPWLVPRYSGSVALPFAFSTALRTNNLRPLASAMPGKLVAALAPSASSPETMIRLFSFMMIFSIVGT